MKKKLTKELILELREKYPTKREIADHLKMDYVTIWRFIKNDPELKALFPTRQDIAKRRTPGCLSGISEADITEEMQLGLPISEIAKKYNVCERTIRRVVKFYL